MRLFAGTLESVDVEYLRTSRYRRRGQTGHHRAPRYRVRYQLQGQSAREAMVVPYASTLIVWRVRSSKPGDCVQVLMSSDEQNVIEWNNQTAQALWDDLFGA